MCGNLMNEVVIYLTHSADVLPTLYLQYNFACVETYTLLLVSYLVYVLERKFTLKSHY